MSGADTVLTLSLDRADRLVRLTSAGRPGHRPTGAKVARALAGLILVLHGAVHLFGAAKGFGWAEVPTLVQPISTIMGLAWLVAAAASVATGGLLLASVRWWWPVGAAAAVLSEFVIIADWSDAALGTLVNIPLAAAAVYAGARHGPTSFQSDYRRGSGRALRAVRSALPGDSAGQPRLQVLTERDLDRLPAPVARYVRQSGAVGRPLVTAFRARIHGRIRAGVGKPWMPFTGEQVNTYGPLPERFFTMHATLMHLPVDVLHIFRGDSATMRVKLCSLLPMVDASGPEMVRGETVTLLNDLCVLAPAALVSARIAWTPVSDHEVRATFTRGGQTVEADLVFNQADQLVGFSSDDRYAASADGRTFRRQRWSTPLRDYRSFGGRTISAAGLGCWDAPDPDGYFAYLEFAVDDVAYQNDVAR